MEPGVPPPPRPHGELPQQLAQQLDEEFKFAVLPPEALGPYEYQELVTPAAEADAPHPAEEAGPSVPKAQSQDDILMYGRKVHVHGELAKKEVHLPQHAPKNINYAAVAREELHDVAVHPPPVTLVPGSSHTGVDEWDKVNSPRKGKAAADFKELLVPGAHTEP